MKEGIYFGTIKKAVTSQSSKGNPQMCITFDVTDFGVGEGWESIRPIERTIFLSLTDGAWEYTERKLTNLGFNGNFDAPVFTEESANLEMKVEEYQGKMKEKWDIAGGSFEATPASADVTRNLNAKWKAKAAPVASAKPKGKPNAPPAQKPVTAGTTTERPGSDDDIPF